MKARIVAFMLLATLGMGMSAPAQAVGYGAFAGTVTCASAYGAFASSSGYWQTYGCVYPASLAGQGNLPGTTPSAQPNYLCIYAYSGPVFEYACFEPTDSAVTIDWASNTATIAYTRLGTYGVTTVDVTLSLSPAPNAGELVGTNDGIVYTSVGVGLGGGGVVGPGSFVSLGGTYGGLVSGEGYGFQALAANVAVEPLP